MKLLVTGAWNCSDEQLDAIRKLGNEIVFMQDEKGVLPDGAQDAEGVICNGLFLYHDIECFKKLGVIQLTSAGFDRVPLDYIKEHNISIYNARGVYSIPMAEFALCGVLQLYKQSRFFCDNQKEKKWEKNRHVLELYGKTVCIVGCGSVGTETAKRFSAFGCRVVGVDIAPYENECYDMMLPLCELDDALSNSDIVVLTLPLTDETRNLFDEQRFDKIKGGSVLVNIARGAVVCENALIDALKNKLYGAVLDVFESEPLGENSPLWELSNVVVTPHNSFVGEGNSNRLFDVIYQNLRREMNS